MKFRCSLSLLVLTLFPFPVWPAAAGSVLLNEIMYHPASENSREEYLELLNHSATNINLAGWQFTKGIQFTFPDVTLAPGAFLVVAADLQTFTNKYPNVINVVGGWTGHLSNQRNTLNLEDAAGQRVNRVEYADEGDWAVRMKGPLDHNHRGWTWHAEPDGLGKSLELINPDLANDSGQNWAASVVADGTPGRANSVARTNVAPLILEVQHLPPIPRSIDSVLITARLVDERVSNFSATLFWRIDATGAAFVSEPMFDDGQHNDGTAGDGVFAATVPPQANNAVVEFYVAATDQEGQSRTWPAPVIDQNLSVLGQQANALYQVDDAEYTGELPLYKLILKDSERAELAQIGSASWPGDSQSDAEMNGTFVSLDGTGIDVRYSLGIRNRGHGTRNAKPNNFRVNFNADHAWKGVTALNLNGSFPHSQLLGAALALKAGAGGANSRAVQVRVNNANLGANSGRMYGTAYAANEVVNSDWAEHWLPADSSGNIYRALRDLAPDDFAYRGQNPDAYTNTWFKQSNTSENDWTDLIALLRVMGTNDLFDSQSARGAIHVEQWLNYLAVMALFDNRETSINRGYNDDYFLYAGAEDRRFSLMYYDLDSLMGEGDSPGSTTATIFGATSDHGVGPAFNRLMHSPEFEPLYYRTLQRQLETTFSKVEFDLTIDQTLGGFVPASVIARMKQWMDGRRTYVQSLVNAYLSAHPVAPVANISGEPRSPTPRKTATLTVGGEGVTQYRYSLNGEPFGPATSIAQPIVLSDLASITTNSVRVIAADANGLWQSESEAVVSKSWIVNASIPSVRINEVLARNVAAFNHSGTFPDAIELYNEGGTTVNLAGLRLTDSMASPGKFTFPSGVTLAPGAYLVVFANNDDGTPGWHTGFSLGQDGEAVFLFDKTANGGALLDSVSFGLQLPDFSIGRINDGGEFTLTQPTLGSANVAQPLGSPHQLKINEWLASEFAAASTDFIELYNADSRPAALGGFSLTDNPIGQPTRHVIPALSFIGGNGFRVFKADGDPQQGFDHLNFKLASEQGLIALLAPDQEIIDCIFYGPQRTDVSQGRSPDGANGIVSFATPSPGTVNPDVTACTVTSTNLNLLTFTSVWKYNQTANLDGVNWIANNYNDAAWPSGSGLLAYENNSAITPLIHTTLANPQTAPAGLASGHAYYFRTQFKLTNDLAGFTVNATAYIDDGAILYVNGTEVSPRIRVPSGAVNNSSWASDLPPGNGDASIPDEFTIPAALFVTGTNVIAVEVHQVQANSSDIVWGMALTATLQMTNCGAAGPVLNEVLANNQSVTNAVGQTPDWVEIYNASTNSIDLAGFSLSDDPGNPRQWIFPANSVVAAGEHLTIECDDLLPASPTNTGFSLSSGGDAVYLFAPESDGGAMIDSIQFGLQAADFSIGRIPDGSGSWKLALPTRDSVNIAAGLGNAATIKINEWMAKPSSGADWLELYNPNAQPVEVSGLALSDDASVRNKSPFPPLSFLAPMDHSKLIADATRGNGADHLNFQLNAENGFIGLYGPVGTQIDAVAYGWQSTDVSQGRFPDGANLVVSFTNTVSGGEPNYLLLTNLVINEVLSHTDPPLEDAIEVLNLSSNAVDISGWYLSNSGQRPQKYLVPPNAVIEPGGFKVFYESQFGSAASPGAVFPFNLNSAHGDEVHLAEATDGALTGYRASAKFGAAANGISFGRFTTSIGEEFVAMSSRSFGVDNPGSLSEFRAGTGAINSDPLVGPVVISEIHFQPTNAFTTNLSEGEFLELLNATGDAVPLYDPAAATNTWKISGGIEFTFPPGLMLPANGRLVLVNFDPADSAASNWFAAAYQLPANVPAAGPYSGSLANEGEDLELLKPDPPQLPPHPDAGFVPYVLVEHVHYSPNSPWPVSSAGESLQRNPVSGFGNEPLNWFAAMPSAGRDNIADSDSDGLPDYWETHYGLSPTNAAGANGAAGDLDGDGQSNRQEFLAGTNPQNAADFLHFESIRVNASGVTLGFHAAGGRSYSVLYSDASPAGPWLRLADAPRSANSSAVEIIDDTFGPRCRFYRLVAPALP